MLRYFETIAPSTAASMSASSKTMNGALPPSSNDSFLIVSALWRISMRPTSVEPVKVILRTIGLRVISPPISPADPVSTESRPLGTPARSARSAKARAENGVSEAGLTTIEQPAASAGPALRVSIAVGKFHGVMAAVVPTGCLIAMMRRSVCGAGIVSP